MFLGLQGVGLLCCLMRKDRGIGVMSEETDYTGDFIAAGVGIILGVAIAFYALVTYFLL